MSAISLRVSPLVLKKFCQKRNTSFRLFHSIWVFLFFNKRLNKTAERRKPLACPTQARSEQRRRKGAKNFVCREFLLYVFLIARTISIHQ